MKITRRKAIAAGAAGVASMALPLGFAEAKTAPNVQSTKDTFGLMEEQCALMDLDLHIQQKMKLVDKWQKYLLGFDAEYAREVATLLENQSGFLKDWQDDLEDEFNFRKFSIPILHRILAGWTSPSLFSVQAMLSPADIYFNAKPTFSAGAIGALTEKSKVRIHYGSLKDLRWVNGLDPQAELCAVFGLELGLELDRFAIAAIRKEKRSKPMNKRTLVSGDLSKWIDWQSEKIDHHKDDDCQFWMICSPESFNVLEPQSNYLALPDMLWQSSLNINKKGKLDFGKYSTDVYTDAFMPTDQVILGRKYGHYDAGIIMHPYTLVHPTPYVYDPDAFCPIRGILRRHNITMANPDYFTVIKLF